MCSCKNVRFTGPCAEDYICYRRWQEMWGVPKYYIICFYQQRPIIAKICINLCQIHHDGDTNDMTYNALTSFMCQRSCPHQTDLNYCHNLLIDCLKMYFLWSLINRLSSSWRKMQNIRCVSLIYSVLNCKHLGFGLLHNNSVLRLFFSFSFFFFVFIDWITNQL